MKKILTSTVTLALSLVFINQVNAQKKIPAAQVDDFLTIQGQVIGKETILDGVTIRLFKGNSSVDSVYTGKNGAFQFKLSKDLYYAIEFDKFGYEKTSVLINTNRWDVDPQNEDNAYQVDFEVELMEEIDGKDKLPLTAVDYDVLDFPKVLIGYKAGEEEGFHSDKKYLKVVKEDLKKIKVIAKKK